jgi:hypothetical protein
MDDMTRKLELDLSIVCCDLGPEVFPKHHRPEAGFWRSAFVDADMALVPRQCPKSVHIETPLSRDHRIFAKKIADLHKLELDSIAKPQRHERPDEIDDQVCECTPQFILRNIPKIERYYDLERALPFDLDTTPLSEATDLVEEARSVKLEPIEFIKSESVNFINDFRAFLEEIFVLCPWEQISKTPPTEDSPWHLNNSTTDLAKDLVARKNKLFIFSAKGMTQVGMKEHKVKKEKTDNMPPKPAGFVSYGPG